VDVNFQPCAAARFDTARCTSSREIPFPVALKVLSGRSDVHERHDLEISLQNFNLNNG
jgi:hypothetical protein